MEILKLKRRAGCLVALCSLVILIVGLVALVPFGKAEVVARADNSDVVGSGGGAIEIADVTTGLISNVYSSREVGRKLQITMPKSTTSVYFAYEVDCSEQVFAIKGEAQIDDDIPYLLHEGKVDKFEVATKTLGLVVSSWSDVTEVYEKKVFTVEVHFNGTLYVECSLDGETDRLKSTSLVRNIDSSAPGMTSRTITPSYDNSGKPIFNYTAIFEDPSDLGAISSARSGLSAIQIYRTEVALEDLTEENLEGVSELITEWPLGNVIEKLYPDKPISFSLTKGGYYYYFVIDRVGNLAIRQLFEGKYDPENQSHTDTRFYVTMTGNGGSGYDVSVKDVMARIGRELDEYKDSVNSDVYSETNRAYGDLLFRFYTGESTTNRTKISNDYYAFYNGKYQSFMNAFSVGATYKIEVINGDLMGATQFRGLNLNKDTVKALGGEEVKANFIVARYESNDLSQDLLDLYAVEGRVKAYKINYTLTVNGIQSTIPSEALAFELMGFREGEGNFKIYLKTISGEYVECEQLSGTNWLRYTTTLNGGEYYLLYTESTNSTDLLPLWITLGVVGGVLVVGGIVLLILWKKGLLKKNAKCKVQDAE